MNFLQLVMVFLLQIIKSDLTLADSSQKSPSGKPALQDDQGHSKNEIPHEEIKHKYDDLHHYYLPMQTTIGSYLDPTVYKASITSPPNIEPASVHKSYDKISSSTVEQDSVTPYVSQCISETPSSEKLESAAILSSRMFVPENHVLSGHTEVFSKTDNEGDVSKISEMVLESSVPFQGTHIYMSTVSDL